MLPIILLGLAVVAPLMAQPEKSPHPPQSQSILMHCFGMATEHQSVTEESSLGSRWWRTHRLFTVVNYTWPKTPGTRVALSKTGEVTVLSIWTHGVSDDASARGLKAITEAEGRAIRDDEIHDYATFLLDCLAGGFDASKWHATKDSLEAAKKELRTQPSPWTPSTGSFDTKSIVLLPSKTSWIIKGWYVRPFSIEGVELLIDGKTGGFALTTESKMIQRSP